MIRRLLARVRRPFAILAALVAAFGGQSASLAETRSDILSKADAVRLFGLTKDQWLQDVRRAVAAGLARQGGDSIGVTMIMQTEDGDLLGVRCDYSEGSKKPAFIQVSVGYRGLRAARFTDQGIADAIEAAQRQMAPEFEVIADAQHIQGGLMFNFMILDKR